MPLISPVNKACGQEGFAPGAEASAESKMENLMDDEPLLITSMCTLTCHLQATPVTWEAD